MIPITLATFGPGFCAGLSWGRFGLLVGVVPLLLILLAVSSVAKGRRRRGNAVGVVCLVLMLAAMAVLLRGTRARRHVRLDLPAISLVPSVKIDAPAGDPVRSDKVEVPVPVPPPKAVTADGAPRHTRTPLDDPSPLTVSIGKGHGAGAKAVVSRAERALSRLFERIGPKAVWSVITACAVAALMFVGYIVLDAGTRGHFTWPLRVLSVLCFGAIITTVVALRHAL